jgi:thioredoxin 1
MQSITMFETSWCPYCKSARNYIDELFDENSKYRDLNLTLIDEELDSELANQYDYYYVPTIYLGNEKQHEGVVTKEIIETIFKKALI